MRGVAGSGKTLILADFGISRRADRARGEPAGAAVELCERHLGSVGECDAGPGRGGQGDYFDLPCLVFQDAARVRPAGAHSQGLRRCRRVVCRQRAGRARCRRARLDSRRAVRRGADRRGARLRAAMAGAGGEDGEPGYEGADDRLLRCAGDLQGAQAPGVEAARHRGRRPHDGAQGDTATPRRHCASRASSPPM